MKDAVRGWRLNRQTSVKLADLASQYNQKIRGWWQYYGTFYKTAMIRFFHYIDQKLERWARRKYKTLSESRVRSAKWLSNMKEVFPTMFSHWIYAAK